MKRLNLICCECGREQLFFGQTVDQVIASIDSSGWIDRPIARGLNKTTCNDCEAWTMRDLGGVKWPAREIRQGGKTEAAKPPY